MSAELTESELAMLQAVGERLKKPFRPEPHTHELSRAYECWRARDSTVGALMNIGAAVQQLDDALYDLSGQPLGVLNESEADKELANLWRAVSEIFPGLTLPAH